MVIKILQSHRNIKNIQTFNVTRRENAILLLKEVKF